MRGGVGGGGGEANLQVNSVYKAQCLKRREPSEQVWPSGKALGWYEEGPRFESAFGSPFSSKVVACRHCLVALSLTIMKH